MIWADQLEPPPAAHDALVTVATVVVMENGEHAVDNDNNNDVDKENNREDNADMAVPAASGDEDDDLQIEICPICMESFDVCPNTHAAASSAVWFVCCGHAMCFACAPKFRRSRHANNCPLCRTALPCGEEQVRMLTLVHATRGRAWAMFIMGFLCEAQGDALVDAVKWYRKAADKGHVHAQTNLGLMHAQGKGVPLSMPKAREYLQVAAAQGDPSAQYCLGRMLMCGGDPAAEMMPAATTITKATTERLYEAEALWQRAAAAGYVQSQYALGLLYSQGCGGIVLKDRQRAEHFMVLAAEGGHPEAERCLEHLLRQKCGWYQQAAFWMSKAVQ